MKTITKAEIADSMAVKYKNIEKISAELTTVKEYFNDYQTSYKDNVVNLINLETIDAIEAVSNILQILQDEGISDAEALKDMMYDYHGLAKQYQVMHQRYETASQAVNTGNSYFCPSCKYRLYLGNEYCARCGKKIQWGKRKK